MTSHPQPRPRVFGVDPGKKAAVAVWEIGASVPMHVERVDGQNAADITESVLRLYDKWSPIMGMAIEDQHHHVIGRGKRGEPVRAAFDGVKTLIRSGARFQQEWERIPGASPVTWVDPAVWQKAMLGGHRKSAEIKKLAVNLVIPMVGRKVSVDEGCAVLIAQWFAKELQLADGR